MTLGYFERVVVRQSKTFPECNGKSGVVLGISVEDGIVHSYAVSFDDEQGFCFPPDELEGTGIFADRSEFYDDNDRIRVRVENDEGKLVE